MNLSSPSCEIIPSITFKEIQENLLHFNQNIFYLHSFWMSDIKLIKIFTVCFVF